MFHNRRQLISAARHPFVAAGVITTTWNPADKSADVTLSGGNLTAANDGSSSNETAVRAIANHSTGKYYYEVTINTAGAGVGVGFCDSTEDLDSVSFLGGSASGCAMYTAGSVFPSGGDLGGFTNGDVVCVAIDMSTKMVWWRTNAGDWNNNPAANPAAGTNGFDGSAMGTPIYPCVDLEGATDSITANFGGSAYAQAPPSGFGNW